VCLLPGVLGATHSQRGPTEKKSNNNNNNDNNYDSGGDYNDSADDYDDEEGNKLYASISPLTAAVRYNLKIKYQIYSPYTSIGDLHVRNTSP
jgi:hypothetical protein